MQEVSINIVALLVAAFVKLALGAFWYSPIGFGARWRALAGCTEDQVKAGMAKALLIDLVTTLIMAFVLAHAVRYAGATNAATGGTVGFFTWLGFIGAPSLGIATYERRPLGLWLITNTYMAGALVIMGAILAAWS